MIVQIRFFLIFKYSNKVTRVSMKPIQQEIKAKLFKKLFFNGEKNVITEIKKKNVLDLPN